MNPRPGVKTWDSAKKKEVYTRELDGKTRAWELTKRFDIPIEETLEEIKRHPVAAAIMFAVRRKK